MASNETPGPSGQPPKTPGFVDRKGFVVSASSRLPSLRGPRDLTLGGATKRTFKPTIPVRNVRSVVKTESNDTIQVKTKNERPARGRGRGRGMGIKREVIQMGSIFEEGPANAPRSGRGGGGGGGGGIGGGGGGVKADDLSQIQLKKYEGPVMTKQEEEDYINQLLRDDFLFDRLKEEETLSPISLPLSMMCAAVKSEKPEKMEVDEVPKVKQEPGVKTEVKVKIKADGINERIPPPETVTAADIFHNDELDDKLLFFQLPDCMPGLPPVPDEGTSKGKQQNETNDAANANTRSVCKLGDVSEGLIGKLRVHESGKVTLKFGSVVLNVELGTPVGFLQDAVAINANVSPGQLTMLGQVKHRFICLPDINYMFQPT